MDLIQSKNLDPSVDSNSGVELSSLASKIAENYNKYHQLELQLQSIQSWIKEQEKIYNGSN